MGCFADEVFPDEANWTESVTFYVRSYSHFSHFVAANANDLGIEGAKAVLYDETRHNFRDFLTARKDSAPDRPFCYWW